MNVCIVGVGGVGGYFGGKLAYSLKDDSSSSKVYFIARGEHLGAIRRSGLTVKTWDGDVLRVRPARASDSFDDVHDINVFIVCVKGYDLDSVSTSLAKKVKKDTVVLPLLNGIDIRERMRVHIRGGIVLPACTYVSSHIKGPGIVAQTGKVEKIILGRDSDNPGYRPDDLLSLFEKASIPYQWEDDPYPALWEKYVFITSFALVTARFDRTFGEILKEEWLRTLVLDIMKEISLVAEAKGIDLPRNVVDTSMKKAGYFPEKTKTSLQLDMKHGKKKNELDLFGATLVRLGKRYHVSMPVSERIYNELLGKL